MQQCWKYRTSRYTAKNSLCTVYGKCLGSRFYRPTSCSCLPVIPPGNVHWEHADAAFRRTPSPERRPPPLHRKLVDSYWPLLHTKRWKPRVRALCLEDTTSATFRGKRICPCYDLWPAAVYVHTYLPISPAKPATRPQRKSNEPDSLLHAVTLFVHNLPL